MSNIRILITASRTWDLEYIIENVLTGYHWLFAGDDITLVSGACPVGGDVIGERVAAALGWKVELNPADWKRNGKAAGPVRNTQMVDKGADLCLAFIMDDSRGATHCADLAEKAGITTMRHKRYTRGLSESDTAEAGVSGTSNGDVLPGLERVPGRAIFTRPGNHR